MKRTEDLRFRATRKAASAATLAESGREYDLVERAKERGVEGVVKGVGILALRNLPLDLRGLVSSSVGVEVIAAGSHSLVVAGEDDTVLKYSRSRTTIEDELLRRKTAYEDAKRDFGSRVVDAEFYTTDESLGWVPGPWIVEEQPVVLGDDLFEYIHARGVSPKMHKEITELLGDAYAAMDSGRYGPVLDVLGQGNIIVQDDESLVLVDYDSVQYDHENERYGSKDFAEQKMWDRFSELHRAIE